MSEVKKVSAHGDFMESGNICLLSWALVCPPYLLLLGDEFLPNVGWVSGDSPLKTSASAGIPGYLESYL
ncbi:MAG: hypothetical protein ACOCVG_05120, partial [Verrucomicrobiota bacterium]